MRDARDFLLCLTSPLFLSLSRFFFLSQQQFEIGCWVFSSTNEKKKKEESLARTHTRVPIAHSHESSVTHLRSPQICCHSPLSFGRLFFPRNVILRKKTEKNAPKKNTPTLYPKVSLGLSQQKSDDFDARGTVHARPIDRARKPSLFFLS